jgi:type II secretory pathway component PulC
VRDAIKNLGVVVLMLTATSVCLGESLRDPTRPYKASAVTTTTSPRFVVNAIIVSADRRVAIVNGRRVGIGGSIDGATVISIDKDELVLTKDGRRITARLHDGGPR